jgi:hypothetical protein
MPGTLPPAPVHPNLTTPSAGFSDNPKPGSVGRTTWKASFGSAPRARVGEQRRDLQELDHRSRPAMRHHERHRVRLGRAQVEEMDVEPVDARHRRIERVQLRFVRAPVVAVPPMVAQRPRPRQRRALAPIVHRFAIGPACVRQPLAQVVERGGGEGEGLRPNGIGHGKAPDR